MATPNKFHRQWLRVMKDRVDRHSQEPKKNIFLFENIRTRQVVYSLNSDPSETPTKTKRFLESITYMGKKTVPEDFRPDMWRPMATISFQSEYYCLDALHKLREFRLKRDYAWRQNGVATKFGSLKPGERKNWLMDQTAHSVADVAATITLQSEKTPALYSTYLNAMTQNLRWRKYPNKLYQQLQRIANSSEGLTPALLTSIIDEATTINQQRTQTGAIRERHTKFWTETCEDAVLKLREIATLDAVTGSASEQEAAQTKSTALRTSVLAALSTPITNASALEARKHTILLSAASTRLAKTANPQSAGRIRRWLKTLRAPESAVAPALSPVAERLVREHAAGSPPPKTPPRVFVTWWNIAYSDFAAQGAWPAHVLHDEYEEFRMGKAPRVLEYGAQMRMAEESESRELEAREREEVRRRVVEARRAQVEALKRVDEEPKVKASVGGRIGGFLGGLKGRILG